MVTPMVQFTMEWLQDPLSLVIVVTVAFLLLQIPNRRRSPPLPPGPKPLPIIGNMQMMDQLTHRGLAALAKEYGGLMHLKLGRLHAFAVSTPEFAREVLQAQDGAFSNRPATIAIAYLTYDRADMAFAHYGAFWRQMRKLCVVKLFSRRRAETWLAVRDESAALVRAVARHGENGGVAVNLGELIFSLTKNVIFRAAFGTRGDGDGDGRQDEFIGILQEFSKLFGAFNIGDFIPWLGWMDTNGINRRLVAARAALDGFIDKIIDEHIERGKNPDDADADMVDDMLAFLAEVKPNAGKVAAGAGDDDLQNTLRLTRDNIKAIIMDVMFGGTETVASAIEWAMAEMMHSPGDLRRLQNELAAVVGLDRNVDERDLENLPFLKCVIKETLRLHPPIPLLLHETASDCLLAGGRYSVPKGSRVMINVWAIGRDRSAWKDADVFRPSRFVAGEGEAEGIDFKGGCFEFLPFGSGRRSCPGMALGLYALELAVARLAHGFDWSLPDGMKPSELDMSDVFGLTAPRAVRLSAVATPRLTCSLE